MPGRFRAKQDRSNAMSPRKKTSSARGPRAKAARYWSGDVTRRSNALDLRQGVFRCEDPRRIAASLKRSAERSARRKGTPYQSAMSMLNFYINRAGKTLPASRKRLLDRAKPE
jgi:hypothetical protein